MQNSRAAAVLKWTEQICRIITVILRGCESGFSIQLVTSTIGNGLYDV